MIGIDYQTFVTQATTQQGAILALPAAKAAHAQASADAQAARAVLRDRQNQRAEVRFRLEQLTRQREHNPLLEAEVHRLDAEVSAAEIAIAAAERAQAAANQAILDLETGTPIVMIGPAVVADHQAALAAAGAKVDHLREVLAALDTRLADHAAALEVRQRQASRDREDARAAHLLGEVGPDNGAATDPPLPPLDQGIQDDQAARAGLARRLAEALAEQERVQALTPRLRETVLAQELAATATKYAAAADKEAVLRSRVNALESLQAQWTGRPSRHHEPRPEVFVITGRDTELARLHSAWAPLF